MPGSMRRKYQKDPSWAAGRFSAASTGAEVLTSRRAIKKPSTGELRFRPYYVQRGIGPNLLDWAYASDEQWDAFHSNITASREGVSISDTEGRERFAINVRWNVEGFGYTFITADNGGRLYQLPKSGKTQILNLNHELATSRVMRNRVRRQKFEEGGWNPSREVKAYLDLSENLLADAVKVQDDGERCGELAQKALFYAMWGSELLELDAARYAIAKRGYRPDFLIGCDARHYYQMSKDRFMEIFPPLFNYAAVNYVVNGDAYMNIFEPVEGQLEFTLRDLLVQRLREQNIAVIGRLLFWFHKWVTPDWLKQKSYDQLLKYVEQHTRDVVRHYGDQMYAWEIVNELHDWANEVELTPEQTVELTRLACDVATAEAPGVQRLINNCCPYAEYVQLGQWSGQPAKYPQRTPIQFTKDLVDAGVDFTLSGQQMYFPYRDLQDMILLIERYAALGKPVQITEIGAPGGPTERSVKLDKVVFPEEPYPWRRPWDEELQADWLEGTYTLFYSLPYVNAVSWFDILDSHAYIDNGGLLKGRREEKKAAYTRLERLKKQWESLQ